MATISRVYPGKEGVSYTFARHETFHLRDGWLFKGLNALKADESSLYTEDAHHNLGIGLNMLKALIYWLQATNLVQTIPSNSVSKRKLQLTPLARIIWEHDPYFEDTKTLWLLHIELSSNRSLATFWYWVFNEFPQRDFTEERLLQGIQHFLEENEGKNIAASSLVKDARCFIRTYITLDDTKQKLSEYESLGCPMASLGLLRKAAIPGHFKLIVGPHRDLPTSLFTYSLYRFRDTTRPGEITLSLEDLRWSPFSPGRLLGLDMHTILQYLEEIEGLTSYAQVIRTAGLNMVTLQRSIRALDLLTEYHAHGD